MRLTAFLSVASFHPDHGGPAVSVSKLAGALAKTDIQVGLWSPNGSAVNSPLIEEHPRITRLRGNLRNVLFSLRDIDIIHDNGVWLYYNHKLAQLAREVGAPRVVTLRGMLEPWAIKHKRFKKSLAWNLYQRRDLATARYHHVTAEAEARNLRAYDLGVPICTIPNGIEIPECLQASPEIQRESEKRARIKNALFLGRIHPVKGLPLLILAWAQVRPADWILEIAGPDEDGHTAEIRRLVRESGLENDVRILGSIPPDQKGGLYRRADLLVLPTHSESFGTVIAEAMSYGVPVLTTKGAPWPIITERRCGWWVDISVAGITEGLIQATTCSPAELKAMGRRGRELVRTEFGWDSVAARMLKLYEKTLSRQIPEVGN